MRQSPDIASVLVIEDSLDDLLLTQRALRKAGVRAQIRTCANGEDAIHCLMHQSPPSLVLLDWKLPRQSGAEVLAWLRSCVPLDATPVIVVSSSRQPEDIEAALATGADAFLEKPVNVRALLDELGRLGLSALHAENPS